MRHQVFGRKLNRNYNQRKALFRSLVYSLVKHGKIKTTEAKAKAFIPFLDKIITKVKKGSVALRRDVIKDITDKETIEKLFNEIGPSFSEKNSGFTRMIKVGSRPGDNAMMVMIEWTNEILKKPVFAETAEDKKKNNRKTQVKAK